MRYKWLVLLYLGICCAAPLNVTQEEYTVTFSDTELTLGEPLIIRIWTKQKNIAQLDILCANQKIPPISLEPGYWQATYTPDAIGSFTVSTNIWLNKDTEPITKQQTISVSKTLSPNKIHYLLQPPTTSIGERSKIQVFVPKPVSRITLIMNTANILLTETGIGLWEGGFTVTTGSVGIFINDQTDSIYRPIRLNLSLPPVEPTDNIFIKGNKSIAYISRTKQGNLETFAEETRREESLNLLINGKQKNVSIDASVFSTTIETVDKKDEVRIRLYTSAWETYLGDYTETISENSLTLTEKTLQGLRFTYTPTDNRYMFFTAKATGAEQTEYLYGNNSQGPFYCTQPPVLPGSERLLVDNTLYAREKDYTIDYRSGKIIFKNMFRQGQTATIRYESSTATNTIISGFSYQHANTSYGFGTTYLQAKNSTDTLTTTNALFTDKVIAVQGSVTINKITIHGEQAWSEFQPDKNLPILKSIAQAGTIQYQNDKAQATLSGTKTGSNFTPIGNKLLAPGLSRTSLNAEYQPLTGNILRTAQLAENYEQYSLNNSYRYYKAFHAEDFFPEIHILNKNTLQHNTSSSNMRKSLDYTRLELIKSVQTNLRLGLTGTHEQEENTLSLDGRYSRKKILGGFLQTQHLEGFDALLGTEQSQQAYYDDLQYVSRNSEHIENYAQVNFYPNQLYRLGLETRMIKDTALGPSEITNADFSFNPDSSLRANGQYTVQSLSEQYASDNYRVQKQKGSFLTRWQPSTAFRTTFKYVPMLSLVHTNHEIVAARQELKNALVDISPTFWFSGKYSYTEQLALAKDLTRINENILQSENKGFHHVYIIKIIPLERIDIELKHRNTRLLEAQRDTTTIDIYLKGTGQEYENSLTLYTRPLRELTLETGYTNEYRDLLFDSATSLDYKLRIETYRTDAKYRFFYFWTLHLFGSFVSSTDLLKPTDNVTHEYTPGLGLAYKISEFAISYDYSRTESTRGEDILSHTYIFNIQYDYSQYIHASIARTQVVSERPRYITTEIIAKFSATF